MKLIEETVTKSVHRCFYLAAQNLRHLHENHKLIQGGINTQNIVIDMEADQVYFTFWAYSGSLLEQRFMPAKKFMRYYIDPTTAKSEDSLLKRDLQALLYLYADVVAQFDNI